MSMPRLRRITKIFWENEPSELASDRFVEDWLNTEVRDTDRIVALIHHSQIRDHPIEKKLQNTVLVIKPYWRLTTVSYDNEEIQKLRKARRKQMQILDFGLLAFSLILFTAVAFVGVHFIRKFW